jgi:hypothetical protein
LEALLKNERGVAGSGMSDEASNRNLIQQNIELRRRLEEEHSSYKRKLQGYQDGQQRQAQLVQRLQAKVGFACSLKDLSCQQIAHHAQRSSEFYSQS